MRGGGVAIAAVDRDLGQEAMRVGLQGPVVAGLG
jgi:hypothetical protein